MLRVHVPAIRSALLLLVLAPLLLTFGLGSFALLGTLESRLEQRLEEDIELIARTLKVPLARALERKRERSVERALRSTFEFGRVYGVYVYDENGELTARADENSEQEPPTLDRLDIEREQVRSEYQSMGGREVYSYFTPLTDAGGQVIGMLQVTRRASEIREYLADTRRTALLVLLGFSAVLVAVILAGHHLAIGRPVRRLARTMQAVAAGAAGARAAQTGPKEIRKLSESFNQMLNELASRNSELELEREQQAKLQSRLRTSEKYALVGRLAAGVAHELGTPLSVVDGHAQRLLRKDSLDQSAHETLHSIRRASARMGTIVQQLLGFGHASSENLTNVSLSRLLKLVAADVRNLFEELCVELQLDIARTDAGVTGDERRLREAFNHLLKNAAYAAKGGSVRVSSRKSRHALTVSIEDSGMGISREDRERVFEPFFTTKPAGEGSGLGLAIVKGVMADHRAEITVRDSPLGGAAFDIAFERTDA